MDKLYMFIGGLCPSHPIFAKKGQTWEIASPSFFGWGDVCCIPADAEKKKLTCLDTSEIMENIIV